MREIIFIIVNTIIITILQGLIYSYSRDMNNFKYELKLFTKTIMKYCEVLCLNALGVILIYTASNTDGDTLRKIVLIIFGVIVFGIGQNIVYKQVKRLRFQGKLRK